SKQSHNLLFYEYIIQKTITIKLADSGYSEARDAGMARLMPQVQAAACPRSKFYCFWLPNAVIPVTWFPVNNPPAA
ncbi:unnamed protein product, partial [Plutella xylostella]